MTKNPLDFIFQDAGKRAFGEFNMSSPNMRAIRMVEEAIETVQVVGVPRDELHYLIDYVYDRPPGEIIQEIGGLLVTVHMLYMSINIDPEEAFLTELRRFLAKDPKQFAARNESKVDAGFTGKNTKRYISQDTLAHLLSAVYDPERDFLSGYVEQAIAIMKAKVNA